MQPRRVGPPRHHQPRADLVGTGFAAVVTAVSILNLNTIGGGEETPTPADQWQLVLACALLAAGLLLIMYGMRRLCGTPVDPRALPFVRRAMDVAAATLWNAGGPERALPLPLMILLLCPVLEAWFDFT